MPSKCDISAKRLKAKIHSKIKKMSEITQCPNCNEYLKNGFMSNSKILSDNKTKIINEYHDKLADSYCNKCGKDLYEKYRKELLSEKELLTGKIRNLISIIPVISTHSPLNWDYKILEMVTGQSTTGTGVISEFTSSFTDLFGAQSGRHNEKLKAGEDLCFSQLRKQALDRGGNAIIATDIDYSELGAGKGMIMVCMAGTAIKLNNLEVLGSDKGRLINQLDNFNKRLRKLNEYSIDNFLI